MSGSLVYESETTQNVTLSDAMTTLDTLCATEFSRTTIGLKVRKMEEEHQDELGMHAEFWTKLAVCAILAHPKTFRGKITSYFALAEACPDKSEDLRLNFYINLHTELKRRHDAEDVKMQSNARLFYLAPYLHTRHMLGYSY
jgi:hypothetical protein